MLKVNKKDSRTRHWSRYSVNLEHISSSSVSIVNRFSLTRIFPYKDRKNGSEKTRILAHIRQCSTNIPFSQKSRRKEIPFLTPL